MFGTSGVVKWFSYYAALTAVENKIPDVNNLVKKKNQIMTQKYYTLNLNIFLQLITINLQVKNLI